ncbi:MAG TPA: hypothetical protein VF463_09110 [Sphingobium sp.]
MRKAILLAGSAGTYSHPLTGATLREVVPLHRKGAHLAAPAALAPRRANPRRTIGGIAPHG